MLIYGHKCKNCTISCDRSVEFCCYCCCYSGPMQWPRPKWNQMFHFPEWKRFFGIHCTKVLFVLVKLNFFLLVHSFDVPCYPTNAWHSVWDFVGFSANTKAISLISWKWEWGKKKFHRSNSNLHFGNVMENQQRSSRFHVSKVLDDLWRR